MKNIILILTFTLLLFSCSKEDVMLSGRISGRVYAYDGYFYRLNNVTGIEVTMTGIDNIQKVTQADGNGNYNFDDVVYGRYDLQPAREGFVPARNVPSVYHIGGYSPTLSDLWLFKVPEFSLYLDSVSFIKVDRKLIIHLKIDGDTLLPDYTFGLPFMIFAGNSPDVSKDNKLVTGKGYFSNYKYLSESPYYAKVAVYGSLYDYDLYGNMNELFPGTVYIRLYPLAGGQGYHITDFYPEALGPPSNVISFNWKELTQQGK